MSFSRWGRPTPLLQKRLNMVREASNKSLPVLSRSVPSRLWCMGNGRPGSWRSNYGRSTGPRCVASVKSLSFMSCFLLCKMGSKISTSQVKIQWNTVFKRTSSAVEHDTQVKILFLLTENKAESCYWNNAKYRNNFMYSLPLPIPFQFHYYLCFGFHVGKKISRFSVLRKWFIFF